MSSSQRSDVYAQITDAIVAAINAGPGTWHVPWHHRGADVIRPTNVASGKSYRGINTVSLWAAACAYGYASGVWGTYRQWKALGLHVRKGERSCIGVFWKQARIYDDRDDADDADQASGDRQRLFARAFDLFNADQIEGYVTTAATILPESERLMGVEKFIAALGIDTVFGSASAYYDIAEDRIHMPDFQAFKDAAAFYATHMHECAHASGAGHRLDRDFSVRFTNQALAMEEATAELTAAFLLADFRVSYEPRADHAAYIASWLQLLRSDNRAIFAAASKAQAAADWMHARQR